jgi:hypothetical protein
MKILITDLYIDCNQLIKEANALYKIAIENDLSFDNKEYLNSMNKYINKYSKFREKLIKNYIEDLKEMIIHNDKRQQ